MFLTILKILKKNYSYIFLFPDNHLSILFLVRHKLDCRLNFYVRKKVFAVTRNWTDMSISLGQTNDSQIRNDRVAPVPNGVGRNLVYRLQFRVAAIAHTFSPINTCATCTMNVYFFTIIAAVRSTNILCYTECFKNKTARNRGVPPSPLHYIYDRRKLERCVDHYQENENLTPTRTNSF